MDYDSCSTTSNPEKVYYPPRITVNKFGTIFCFIYLKKNYYICEILTQYRNSCLSLTFFHITMLLVLWHFNRFGCEISLYLLLVNTSNFKKIKKEELGFSLCCSSLTWPICLIKGRGGICGPWIPDDGQIFTHTLSTAGKMSQRNWTARVRYIYCIKDFTCFALFRAC